MNSSEKICKLCSSLVSETSKGVPIDDEVIRMTRNLTGIELSTSIEDQEICYTCYEKLMKTDDIRKKFILNLTKHRSKRKFEMYDDLDLDQFLPDSCSVNIPDVLQTSISQNKKSRYNKELFEFKREKLASGSEICFIDTALEEDSDVLKNVKRELEENVVTFANDSRPRNHRKMKMEKSKDKKFKIVSNSVDINLLEFRLRDPHYRKKMLKYISKFYDPTLPKPDNVFKQMKSILDTQFIANELVWNTPVNSKPDEKIILSKYSNILDFLKNALNEPMTIVRKTFHEIQSEGTKDLKEKAIKLDRMSDSMTQLQDVQFVIEGDFEFELISTVKDLKIFITKLNDEKYFNNILRHVLGPNKLLPMRFTSASHKSIANCFLKLFSRFLIQYDVVWNKASNSSRDKDTRFVLSEHKKLIQLISRATQKSEIEVMTATKYMFSASNRSMFQP